MDTILGLEKFKVNKLLVIVDQLKKCTIQIDADPTVMPRFVFNISSRNLLGRGGAGGYSVWGCILHRFLFFQAIH